jgi:hypothetical protein
VGTINNVKQGSYEPAIYLVTPKKQQLLDLGIDYALSKNTSVITEVAMSIMMRIPFPKSIMAMMPATRQRFY